MLRPRRCEVILSELKIQSESKGSACPERATQTTASRSLVLSEPSWQALPGQMTPSRRRGIVVWYRSSTSSGVPTRRITPHTHPAWVVEATRPRASESCASSGRRGRRCDVQAIAQRGPNCRRICSTTLLAASIVLWQRLRPAPPRGARELQETGETDAVMPSPHLAGHVLVVARESREA